MSRFWIGVAAGLVLAWTALALWRRIPPLPDFELEIVERYR